MFILKQPRLYYRKVVITVKRTSPPKPSGGASQPDAWLPVNTLYFLHSRIVPYITSHPHHYQPCQLWYFPAKSSGCIQVSPVVPIKSFITKESSLELAVATPCFSFGGGGCAGSSLLHAGFLQLWQVGATLPCCVGFSWQPLLLLQSTGSSCPAACGIFPESCGIFPKPGIKPVSPTLAGRFLTTEPPEKSCYFP